MNVIRPYLPLSLLGFVMLAGCGDKIGESCTVGGVANDEVAYQAQSDECDGATCLFLDGFGSFCTDDCAVDDDCPHGFECIPVDVIPTAVEQLETLCVPEEPVGDDDDSTAPPVGSPPEISELRIWDGPDPDSGQCLIRHEFVWHDDDGDLNGAQAWIEFRDPGGVDADIRFKSNIELLDTVDTTLTFQLVHDGSSLAYSTTYNVYVWIKDRANNKSNELAEGGYQTPSATCE